MRLSIATKIFIAFAGITVVFTSVLMFGAFRTQALHSQIRAINLRIVPLSLVLSDVQTDLKSFHVVLNERDPLVLRRTLQFTRLVFSLPERFDERIRAAAAMAEPGAARELLGPELAHMQGVHQRLGELHEQAQHFSRRSMEFSDLVLSERAQDGAQAAEALAKAQNQLRIDARSLDQSITSLRNDLRVLTDLALTRANDNERSSLYALGALSGLALVMAIALLIVVLLTVRPLTVLTEAARRIGQGDYRPLNNLQKRALGTDEIALLTREFNSMAVSLGERDARIHTQHAALIRSERLATIGRMTSLITHELRNPLSSINLNAEMLMDSLNEHGINEADPEVMPLLETIIGEVDRLRDITEEYLVYARLPTPKLEVENVRDIIQGLIDFHVWEWAQQEVAIDFDVESDEVLVEVDANQLRQALLNILKNAIEASPPESTVFIEVRCEAERALIEVRDAGAGIGEDVREHIFEPFFTTKGNGTGLGLPMTQQIIEQHAGQIHITSTGGQGTTFTIALPLAQRP
ncbi:MAG: HAMP domain-containing histidine kinase [Bradymonadaceae bacterium]|nr:HAMP domain-containing histidine kinase [Lujinxingiaceae bacterium]